MATSASKYTMPNFINFFLQILPQHLPNEFLKIDPHTLGKSRHLILATNEQLELLSKAKQWFADGTFKIAPEPFKQLFSIHAYIKAEDGGQIHVPLVYVLMTDKKKGSYRQVNIMIKLLYVAILGILNRTEGKLI